MKSSTKLALVTAVGLMTGLSSQAAMAIPSSAAFTPGVNNTLRDSSAEIAIHGNTAANIAAGNVGQALGAGQSLQVGDYLIGYFYISSTIEPNGAQVGNGNVGGYDVVTGMFATEVMSRIPYTAFGLTGAQASHVCSSVSTLTTCSQITFGSGGTSIDAKLAIAATGLGLTAADLARFNAITPLTNANSMLAFFEQPNNTFNNTPATVEAALNTASAGTVRLVVGDTASTGTNPDTNWSANAPSNPSQLATLTGSTSGGGFSFNENILYSSWPTGTTQVTANGTIYTNVSGAALPIADQTAFSFDVNAISVPEPGALALLSIGLSAFGFGRKRWS